MQNYLKLGAAMVLIFSASGCAIHGCSGSAKWVCDPECRWEVGFDCDFGPPYPDPEPYPIPPFHGSASGGDLAAIAAQYGESDSNGDGVLSCSGVYWVETATWVGSCD
ncbi:MAG: hypothetical protein OXU77_14625 [Gammaproteobacteria bacterium]|nr:hypothetical protein [Gammaproteobacteria bacterium]MDE0441004.1 hypothetical protein [Gammaproteobacteria bacterium]